jgi:hypothetical protein
VRFINRTRTLSVRGRTWTCQSARPLLGVEEGLKMQSKSSRSIERALTIRKDGVRRGGLTRLEFAIPNSRFDLQGSWEALLRGLVFCPPSAGRVQGRYELLFG